MIEWLKEWWLTATTEQYELTVWFPKGIDEPKSKKIFFLSDVTKKTQTHFIGKDLDGKKFEIRTVEPFDFYLRKIY